MKELTTVWALGIAAMVAVLAVQKQEVRFALQAMAVPAALGAGTAALVVYGFKSGAID